MVTGAVMSPVPPSVPRELVTSEPRTVPLTSSVPLETNVEPV
jgi:hypothetical protein